MNLSGPDRRLVQAAEAVIRLRFRPKRHEIAAALRAGSGRVYTSLQVESSVGNCDLCAEWGAIAAALTRGEGKFESIVSVRFFPEHGRCFVVPPCGTCRELISDLGAVTVIISNGSRLKKEPIRKLLPERYADRKATIRRGRPREGFPPQFRSIR
jgi:cytidine deaminase